MEWHGRRAAAPSTARSRFRLREMAACVGVPSHANAAGRNQATRPYHGPLRTARLLALAEVEREAGPSCAHMLHGGDLCDDPAGRPEDFEEPGVGELELLSCEVEIAAKPGCP